MLRICLVFKVIAFWRTISLGENVLIMFVTHGRFILRDGWVEQMRATGKMSSLGFRLSTAG